MERLKLLTTKNCHLCDDARAAMDRVQTTTGVAWHEIDIANNTELAREYGDRLPVILLDGKEHGYWQVEEARLIKDLTTN